MKSSRRRDRGKFGPALVNCSAINRSDGWGGCRRVFIERNSNSIATIQLLLNKPIVVVNRRRYNRCASKLNLDLI